jgi:hypothetical protein
MRILSLSFPLPGACVDNYNFLNAPVFFDYDAVVVDPHSISQLVEDVVANHVEHFNYAREQIVNAPSGLDGVGLAELLHDRADETARLLARGGLVICLATPNTPQPGIRGYADFERFSWLEASGIDWNPPFVRRGAGTEFDDFEMTSAFGTMLHQIRSRLAYQVHFEEDVSGRETAVLARSVGGVAVAVSVKVAGGTIILMPPPARPLDSHGRYQVSEALQRAVRQHLRRPSVSSPPRWLAEYSLPGLKECRARRSASAEKFVELESELAATDAELERFDRLQRLLWDEGSGFDEAVRASLEVLGFRVSPIDQPGRIEPEDQTSDHRTALLETDSSDVAVGLDVHFRMRRRLEEALIKGTHCRGLVVINGYRRTAPDERLQQYTKELKFAAEQMRYCLVQSDLLFCSVHGTLGGDSRMAQHIREQLLITEGVLQTE